MKTINPKSHQLFKKPVVGQSQIHISGLCIILAMVLILNSCDTPTQPQNSVDEANVVTNSEMIEFSSVSGDLPFEGYCNGDVEPKITCDPNTGLEWLDLTETNGITYPQMLDKLANDPVFSAYRYATNAEVVQLFANAHIDPPNSPFLNPVNLVPVTNLQNLVGITLVSTIYTIASGFTGDASGGTTRSIGVLQRTSVAGMSYLSNTTPESESYGHWLVVDATDPETKDDCKQGGWEDFGFKNQGQCVRYVNTGKDSR